MKPKQILLAAASTGITFALCLPVIVHSMKSNAVPIGTIHTDKAAIYGWALPPNTYLQFANPDTREPIHYRTNMQGWKDVPHSFNKQKKRIIVTGDSVTFAYVPIEKQYSRILERMLPDYEVISMGVGGWGTDQIMEAYENEGRRYRPDIVVYQFSGNDIGNNLGPAKSQIGITTNIYWNKPWRFFLQDGLLHKYVVQRGVDLPDFSDGDGWPLFSALLSKFKQTVEADGSQFAVLNARIDDTENYRKTIARLESVCRANQASLIPSAYSDYDDYRNDAHPTELGNRQIAEDIKRFVLP